MNKWLRVIGPVIGVNPYHISDIAVCFHEIGDVDGGDVRECFGWLVAIDGMECTVEGIIEIFDDLVVIK